MRHGWRGAALTKEIGIIGLGKMGAGLARQWHEKGWRVVAYNRHPEKAKELEADGIEGAATLDELDREIAVAARRMGHGDGREAG